MKTISLILFGSILTIGLHFVDIKDIYLISSANAAGKNKPCRVISANENEINNLFRFGYRVKGVGSAGAGTGSQGYSSPIWNTTVVMCKK